MDRIVDYCKRIIGGNLILGDELKYPFMATIWYLDGEEFSFKCGASYIGKNYFITAAHCLKQRDPRMTIIRMGSNNLSNLPDIFRIKTIFIHPKFNRQNLKHDIAIIETTSEPDSIKYPPIRLPCNQLLNICYVIGSSVKVIGFGKADKKGKKEYTEDLKEVDLKIKMLYDTKYSSSLICSDVFLAGDEKDGVILDSCTGDSGGPCMKKIKDYWVLVGIVSWGSGCGEEKYPGVYTKVLSYHNWIREICKFPACANH
jgi:secreted trypsin-like serine protease